MKTILQCSNIVFAAPYNDPAKNNLYCLHWNIKISFKFNFLDLKSFKNACKVAKEACPKTEAKAKKGKRN